MWRWGGPCRWLQARHRHEHEAVARRKQRRLVVLEADLGGDQPHCAGKAFHGRHRAAIGRKLGRIELGEGLLTGAAAHAHAHGADGLFQHDQAVALAAVIVGGRGTAQVREQDGGADGRVARERQLGRRREDAHARSMGAVLRLQDEHRLGQVEFAGDGLHALGRKLIGIEDDSERIAAEPLLGEHVENVIREQHGRILSKRRKPLQCRIPLNSPSLPHLSGRRAGISAECGSRPRESHGRATRAPGSRRFSFQVWGSFSSTASQGRGRCRPRMASAADDRARAGVNGAPVRPRGAPEGAAQTPRICAAPALERWPGGLTSSAA